MEKEMTTHSSILAQRILWTGEPGGLISMGSHRVGHDWSDLEAAAICITTYIYCSTLKFRQLKLFCEYSYWIHNQQWKIQVLKYVTQGIMWLIF